MISTSWALVQAEAPSEAGKVLKTRVITLARVTGWCGFPNSLVRMDMKPVLLDHFKCNWLCGLNCSCSNLKK